MSLLRGDRELLTRFREGDSEALEKVYRAYVDVVDRVIVHGALMGKTGRMVFGPREHQDRLDLLQETFIRAFSQRTRQAYDGVRDYQPFLLSICRRVIIDWLRKKGRSAPESLTDPSLLDTVLDENEIEQWADPWVMDVVRKYVSELKPPLSSVFEHRFILGESQRIAAEQLGINRQRLRGIEDRLKKGLAKALQQAGVRWEP